MAKRTATRELTDRNWDDEEEPEEAGQFVQASDDVIKGRQIKKAKRRGVTGSSEEGASVFSGFGGFKPVSSSTASTGGFSAFTDKSKNGSNTDVNNSSKSTNGKSDTKSESDYLANLKSLNESVVTWIKQHVDKNPFCILTPIFKDYEKHLEELEKEKREKKSSVSGEKKSSVSAEESKTEEKKEESKAPVGSGFTFSTNGTSASKFGGFGSGSGFNFGSTTTTTSSSTSGFSFGTTTTTASSSFSATTTSTTGFSFGTKTATAGFSFGTSVSTASTSSTSSSQPKTGDDEDEYVPPTVEVSEVKEDGAFYTKRGKLFYQKEGKWVEKGVGNIHLKKVQEKLQLIIRADTNLGNILLNIMLTDGIPVKKQGKNNVFFVCVPNPPFDPKAEENKPVPILLRVKTSEDAEELVSKIEENKK